MYSSLSEQALDKIILCILKLGSGFILVHLVILSVTYFFVLFRRKGILAL